MPQIKNSSASSAAIRDIRYYFSLYTMRLDHQVIKELVATRSTVLDLGCGDGELLSLLIKEKEVQGQGIEIDEQEIYKCVEKGLNIIHGDIDSGLHEYQDKSFEYVILNQSLQQVKHFDTVFTDALRVGKHVIAGLPNFAYYQARIQLGLCGKAPVTKSLPYSWYNSPNVHFFSITDFKDYCQGKKITIERSICLDSNRKVYLMPNLFAQVGIFLVRT
jgi:methionine biosynthesis protein MetW